MMMPGRAMIMTVLLTGLLSANMTIAEAEVSSDVIKQAIVRTVLLLTLGREGQPIASCSGAFISPSGVILTAAHCLRAGADDVKSGIRKGELYNPNGLVAVGVNFPDQVKPVIALLGRRVADNPSLDVGLVKIVAMLDHGTPRPLPAGFRVPFMTITDTESVGIGDSIAVLGFPDKGGDSINVNQGHVTGFVADDQNIKLKIKHDAVVSHGASGGPVINSRGQLIAITQGANVNEETAFAVQLAIIANRIPMAWAAYLQDGDLSASDLPQPGPPTPTASQVVEPAQSSPSSAAAQLPAPQRAATAAVIRGRVVDADNRAGIPGALVVVLRPGTSPYAITRADILAMGRADVTGYFQTNPPVSKGATYPVVVASNGYQPTIATIEISDRDPDVITLRPVVLRQ